MTLYAAFDCTPGPFPPGPVGTFDCVPDAGLGPDAPLGPAEARLLAALFSADGATVAALGRRAASRRPAVQAALGGLAGRGLVEQVASRVWLTGRGFATRRSAGSARVDAAGS